ncbi:MAG: sulfur transferase domain-containing protein [Gammaproteobacteria bacterium]
MTLDIPYAFPVGRLLAAGQPDPAQLQAAKDAGYGMVVNLRVDGEAIGFDERAVVEALGMQYRHIPVGGAAGVTRDNARALQSALADAGDAPVIVHCGTANRVGALVAVAAAMEGAPANEALEKGRRAGLLGLEAHVRELIEGWYS